MTPQPYRRAIGQLYHQFTSNRLSRYDQRFVDELFARSVPLDIIRAALILGAARRLARDPKAPPLPQVRSFYYFRHLIDEILDRPLPPGYIAYIEFKLNQLASQNKQ